MCAVSSRVSYQNILVLCRAIRTHAVPILYHVLPDSSAISRFVIFYHENILWPFQFSYEITISWLNRVILAGPWLTRGECEPLKSGDWGSGNTVSVLIPTPFGNWLKNIPELFTNKNFRARGQIRKLLLVRVRILRILPTAILNRICHYN